jgi:hypothetical protein
MSEPIQHTRKSLMRHHKVNGGGATQPFAAWAIERCTALERARSVAAMRLADTAAARCATILQSNLVPQTRVE